MEQRNAKFYLFQKAPVNLRLDLESAPLCAMPYLPRKLLASFGAWRRDRGRTV
jgi:hypothetical protein